MNEDTGSAARDVWLARSHWDHLRRGMLIAIAAAPGVGGAGAEIFDGLVPSALERRRATWIELLDNRLARVERVLCDEDEFVTVVLNATRVALGTHYEEKLQLLAGCVASTAENRGENDFVAMRFLRFVDELSPQHFMVLQAIADSMAVKGDQTLWRDVIALLPDDFSETVWYVVIEDLQQRHLIFTTGYHHDNPVENYIGSLINLRREGVELLLFVEILADESDSQGSSADEGDA